MNIRKPVDYSATFAVQNTLMAAGLPQIELYCEIGKLIHARPEKGAAVAAAEYLSKAYPDAKGFSPRNLRRMREFYRAYGNMPEVMKEAMTIGWTQNVTILEGCKSLEERTWYIRMAHQFNWTKAELTERILAKSHSDQPLDSTKEVRNIEENSIPMENPHHTSGQYTQRNKAGNCDSRNRLSYFSFLLDSQLFYRRIYSKLLLVRGWLGWSMGASNGTRASPITEGIFTASTPATRMG